MFINKKIIFLSLFFINNIFSSGDIIKENKNVYEIPKDIINIILDYILYSSKSEEEIFENYNNLKLVNKNFKNIIDQNKNFSPKDILYSLMQRDFDKEKLYSHNNVSFDSIALKYGSSLHYAPILKKLDSDKKFDKIFRDKSNINGTLFENSILNNHNKFAIFLVSLFKNDEIFIKNFASKTIFDYVVESKNKKLIDYLVNILNKISILDKTSFDFSDTINLSKDNRPLNSKLKLENLKIKSFGYFVKNLKPMFVICLPTFVLNKFLDMLCPKLVNSERFSQIFDKSSDLKQGLINICIIAIPVAIVSWAAYYTSDFLMDKLLGSYSKKVPEKYSSDLLYVAYFLYPYFPGAIANLNRNFILYQLHYTYKNPKNMMGVFNKKAYEFILRLLYKK